MIRGGVNPIPAGTPHWCHTSNTPVAGCCTVEFEQQQPARRIVSTVKLTPTDSFSYACAFTAAVLTRNPPATAV